MVRFYYIKFDGMNNVKRILITGANSYIGTSFEKYLKPYSDEYTVDTLDMIDVNWKEYDFSCYDTVFHVAGIAHSDSGKISAEKTKLYYDVNTNLTIETAKKAKTNGVKQFIFMSSAIVYGESGAIGKPKKITISTPLSPSNSYGDSKVQAEKGLRELEDDNFKVVILRPPMIYGKGSKGNYPLLAKIAKSLPAFPYVENCRSMLYIENLMEFVKLMIDNEESGIFFPQNSEYSNTSELVELIGEVHGKKVRLIKGFEWVLKIIGKFTGVVNKAFGNLYYDMSMSEYKNNYIIADLNESIRKTEGAKVEKSNKKRVLVLASVASMIDQFNIPNIKLLQSLGATVDVACNFKDGSTCTDEVVLKLRKQLKSMGVRCFQIDFARSVTHIFQNVRAFKQVKKLMDDNNYTFVHCHSPIGGIVGRIAGYLSKTKVIYTAHGFHFYKGAPKKNWLLFYPAEKICSYMTDVLITINKEDYSLAKQRMKAKKVEYLPGIGINLNKFNDKTCDNLLKEKLGCKSDEIMLLSVGELSTRKNHEVVIKSLVKLKNEDESLFNRIKYFIVGKGDLENYLLSIIKDNNLENNVHLLGFRSDVDELLRATDVFVFPSLQEGLPVALMEAMASGLPVIASRIRGNTDLIENGKGGFLVSSNDVMGFEKCIRKLVKNPDYFKNMKSINLSTIKGFSDTIIIKKTEKIYSDLM